MGQLTSHRRTVLLALGLVALAAVVAAPGAADQTERINQSFQNNETLDVMITLEDTGQTTSTQDNSSNAILKQNTTTINEILAIPDRLMPKASKITVSTERKGANIIFGNLSQHVELGVHSPKYVEINTNTTITASVVGFGENSQKSEKHEEIQDSARLSVDESSSGVSIVWIVPVSERNKSINFNIISEFYNKTITPGDSVEALRVAQTNAATVESARVRIKTTDGSTIINETLPDAQTSVGYGAVALDNHSEYRVTVTGINNDTDGPPDYSVQKLKSNSPVISIGPPGSSNTNTLIWLVVVVGGVALFLRTRD